MATSRQTEILWQFGGWLRDLPVVASAGILILLFAAAFLVARWSYGKTLQPLTAPRRRWLLGLRTALIFLVLLCLANPVRLTREYSKASESRRIAVLVDKSESMQAPDNRKETRLDRAWNQWLRNRPSLTDTTQDHFVFGKQVVALPSENQVLTATVEGENTALYLSLFEILNSPEKYDEIITLTDGLDTTGANSQILIRQSLAARTPLSFLPAENRLRPKPQLRIQEASVPPRALKNTSITVNAVVESFSETSRSLPVRLLKNGQKIAEQTITVGAGKALRPVAFPVKIEEAGRVEFVVTAGDGAEEKRSKAILNARSKLPAKILFYQGALDWGYRFFARALSTDPSFELNTVFSPQLGIRTAVSNNSSTLSDLPSEVGQLADYDLIVLSQVFPGQLTTMQERALQAFVRQGGAVLFSFSNSEAIQGFEGTILEQMLPVVFAPQNRSTQDDYAARLFQDRMKQSAGGASSIAEADFAHMESSRPLEKETSAFAFTSNSPLAALFRESGGRQIVPEYFETAPIYQSKPGAEVLAVSGKDVKPARILLAIQPYGQGRSSVLATEMLWHWSLAQPSSSDAAEIFWQQFALWLAQPIRRGIQFTDGPGEVEKGKTAAFSLTASPGITDIKVEAHSPSGKVETLSIQNTTNNLPSVEFRPEETGEWRLLASSPAGGDAEKVLSVGTEDIISRERNLLPTDTASLQKIAEATGGRILQPGQKLAMKKDILEKPLLVSQVIRPLWNTWWLFLAVLGCLTTELLLRRHWKLL